MEALSLITGKTTTNPNDTKGSISIDVKLDTTGQIIKALYLNKLDLDEREQLPNIKVGTQVMMLLDDLSNFIVMGSFNHNIEMVGKQIYIVENKEEVLLKSDDLVRIKGVSGGLVEKTSINTNKIEIKNNGNEIISIISSLMGELIALQTVDNGCGCAAGSWSHDKVGAISGLKSKLDSFLVN